MGVSNDFHFRLLESFLDHVKDSAVETVSDVLAVDGEFISSLLLGIEGTVATAMKILRSLKDLAMTLHALWKAVEDGLSMTQKILLPATRHHGILSLPLETVVRILRQVYDSDADCATQSIPLVSRYFRNIAIGIPQLWIRLTPGRNPVLSIERSKRLGLEVDLFNCRGPHYTRFLEMVAPEAERWTLLTIPSRYAKFDVDDFVSTLKVLGMKTFTALRELRIDGTGTWESCKVGTRDRTETEQRPRPFYGTVWDFDWSCGRWNMPSLRTIKSENTLPSIQLTSLTCFHLHVCAPYYSEIGLEKITRFLQSVPSLTELSLDIGCFDTVEFRAGSEATLPNVKTLRLGVEVRDGPDPSLTDFLASLHTPNLSDLSVDVTTDYAYQLIDWIRVIFPEENSFWPSLESLDLSMCGESRYDDSDDESDQDEKRWSAPDDLLERIPAVRRLSISAVNVDLPDPADWNVQLPQLRTLCFRDCNKFDTDFILNIGGIFEAPEFETLKIHNCKKIDAEVVWEMMPEGKAFVSTVNWNNDITVL